MFSHFSFFLHADVIKKDKKKMTDPIERIGASPKYVWEGKKKANQQLYTVVITFQRVKEDPMAEMIITFR